LRWLTRVGALGTGNRAPNRDCFFGLHADRDGPSRTTQRQRAGATSLRAFRRIAEQHKHRLYTDGSTAASGRGRASLPTSGLEAAPVGADVRSGVGPLVVGGGLFEGELFELVDEVA
jgi:hypothetical protein